MHLTESEWFGQVNTAHQTWRQATAPTGYANDEPRKPKSAFWLKPLSFCVLSTGRKLALVCFPGENPDERSTLAILLFHTLSSLFICSCLDSFHRCHFSCRTWIWNLLSIEKTSAVSYVYTVGSKSDTTLKTWDWKSNLNLDLTGKLKDLEKCQKLHRYHSYYNMNGKSSTVIKDLLLYI